MFLSITGFRSTVNEIFDEFIMDAFDSVGPVMRISFIFAKIGLAVFALLHFASNDRANVLKALKWFPLMFILVNYPVFARAIFDFYHGLGESFLETQSSWDDIQLRIAGMNQQAMENMEVSYNIFNLDSDAVQMITLTTISSGLTTLAHLISTIFFVGVKALSIMYLFVLIMFGPLNIGLSFIPALSGMWKAWLQKFMNVCLWVPMLYVVDSFMLKLIERLVDQMASGTNYDLSMVLGSGFMMMMSGFFYVKAPSLANFIVQGLNVAGPKAKHYGKKAANAAMDAKTGGATQVIRGLTT